MTIELVTQETVKLGVVLFVILSVFNTPESVHAVISGVPVETSAVVSV